MPNGVGALRDIGGWMERRVPGGWAVPLLETLENGRYGRDYLAGLDAGLPG
ncbi:MAG: hypothetical protein HOQ36_20550 [Nocardia sp.]|nr:hypothetical protein [Nocardia sp.]